MSDTQEPLTEEQIENWRRVLAPEYGPMAYSMTPEDIEHYRKIMQQHADELAEKYPEEES